VSQSEINLTEVEASGEKILVELSVEERPDKRQADLEKSGKANDCGEDASGKSIAWS
jgi:hypothetical protein